MAELLTVTKPEVARQAGQKAHPTAFNNSRQVKLSTVAVWAAGNGDTAASDIVIPAGSWIIPGVILSCAAGTASTTLSMGLRDATTKAVIDATALLNAAAINAATIAQLLTGTKFNTGQDYIVPVDAEVYWTFGGGVPLANQQIVTTFAFVSP